jgi:hypothetical protein
MSGIDDLMAQSKERWASAKRRAEGLADKGLGQAVKRITASIFLSGVRYCSRLGLWAPRWSSEMPPRPGLPI